MPRGLALLVGCALVAAFACGPAASVPRAPHGNVGRDNATAERFVEHDFIEPLGTERGLVSKQVARALLARSVRRWRELAAAWPHGYGYLRSYHLDGYRYRHTYAEVERGQVVARLCIEVPGTIETVFRETRDEIGLHEDCHPVLTVEQIHERCRDLIERAPGQVRVRARADGLLGACALPASRCHLASADCLTLHAVYPLGERPCPAAAELHQDGSEWPTGELNPAILRHCQCQNGLVACED